MPSITKSNPPSADHRPWLIVGHYGGHSTGDDAMLLSVLQHIDLGPSQDVLVTSKSTYPIGQIAGRRVHPVPMRTKEVISAISKAQGVLFGGGLHFHDNYVFHRLARHMRYMVRLVAVCWVAYLSGKRVVWMSAGFGPMEYRLTAWITRISLKTCEFVHTRETTSANVVANWISPKKLASGLDIALLMNRPEGAEPPRPEKNLLGINLTTFAKHRIGGEEAFQLFRANLLEAVTKLLRHNPGLNVHLIVFRGGDWESDEQLSRKFASSLEAEFGNRVTLRAYHTDPVYMLDAIAGCQWLLSSRLHALILGYKAGVPTLAIEYHPKVRYFAREVGMPEEAVISIIDAPSTAVLLRRLERLIHEEGAYAPDLDPQSAQENVLAAVARFNQTFATPTSH